MTVEDRHRAEASRLLMDASLRGHDEADLDQNIEAIATALAEAEARGAREEREAASSKFLFNASYGEMLFEIPGKIVVSIEPDGVGYAIFDAGAGSWKAGKHIVSDAIEDAGEEIAAAIRSREAKE